jgi:hypothetical protein
MLPILKHGGGNVDQKALVTDLEAVRSAGISGIQLFHGKGRPWPGVTPQVQTLSPTWDGLISKVADEAERLGLNFTMQNCPGWAMSGGPWITPDKAMRHLISNRRNITGGNSVSINLQQPQPSAESWRDYQDIAVLAFPTPEDDDGQWVKPVSVASSLGKARWSELLSGKDAKLSIPVSDESAWVEFVFAEAVSLRSIELPPIEHLMKRVSFDPNSEIAILVDEDNVWTELIRHPVPRGNWQDRQPEVPYVMAVPDAKSKRYRIVFHNQRPMEISQLRLSTTARLHDWRAQAGYALRSLERAENPKQSPSAWVRRSSIVDLTDTVDEDGHLDWEAPQGDWTVVRFGHVNTGIKNKPAPPEATGFECDKFSTAGADQHFAGYIGRLSNPGGALDGGRLKGMLIDSWECYTQTWTPAMEEQFRQRRGYSLRTWLPALAGWVVDDHLTSERFLRDWRATISDLIVENYYGRMAELGRERGLKLSFETSVGDVSPGDIMQYFRAADIPMCEVWQPNDPHDGGLETKPVAVTASAAHVYGKPRIAAEAFTSAPLDWRKHPFALKNVADRSFALGITHLVFHTYTHNPLDKLPGTSFGNRIGAPFIRGQTWWKHMPHFTRYLARCGLMLEQGQPVADVLRYLGDDLDHKPRQDAPFPSGYHFDYLNADALLNRIEVKDGDLVVPGGTKWRVLWLPRGSCRRLTPTTLRKIKQLLLAGATVIGQRPDINPSLSGGKQANADFDSLVKEIWGAGDASNGDRRMGQGRLIWGENLASSLKRLEISPDVQGTLSEKWCHRRVGDQDIYFVIGDRLSALDANLHFRATGTPMFWNPMNGQTTPVPFFRSTDTGTSIRVQLPVAGSVFVVFEPPQATTQWEKLSFNGELLVDAGDSSKVDETDGFPPFGVSREKILQPWVKPEPLTFEILDEGKTLLAWRDGDYQLLGRNEESISVSVSGSKTIPLLEKWNLSFPSGWDAPRRLQLERAAPWSSLEDEAVRNFSGTATYETTFQFGDRQADQRIVLDLGRVGNIANVEVNGQDAGVLWAAPYRQDITEHVKSGENILKVAVTNTWHNRLAYDASLPKDQRKTWTYHAPAANSPLDFAGIEDSVKIQVGKLITLPQP